MLELRYTGHPLIDVGLATLAAYAGRDSPEELTEADLEKFAEWAIQTYDFSGNTTLNTWLGVSVFPNAYFANFAARAEKFTAERKRDLSSKLLDWREVGELENRCAFCARQAVRKVARDQVPMLMGREIINFTPEGDVEGLPVCGVCLLAIHAMPLGCLPSAGRLLLVHSHAPGLMEYFASRHLGENRTNLQMAGIAKMKNYQHPRTRLLETLEEIFDKAWILEEGAGLTAYHFTNYTQNAAIDIFYLPPPVLRFIRNARMQYPAAWKEIVRRAWAPAKEGEYAANHFYEALFNLPQNTRLFLRTYILRTPLQRYKQDPRRAYNLHNEADLVSWGLTELFLQEMMNMERERIDKIRELGDALAAYIQTRDSRLFGRMYLARQYPELRRQLIRAAKQADTALVPFDTFVAIFEDSEEVGRPDWRLACDLLLIRIIEQLHQVGKDELLKQVEEAPEEAATA